MFEMSGSRNTAVTLLRQAVTGVLVAYLPWLAQAAIMSPEDSVPLLSLNTGVVGLDDRFERPARHGVEYRHTPFSKWQLSPSAGYAWAEDGASYTYIDVKRDFRLHERWFVTPSFGPGYFSEGSSLDLGHELEFRSGVEISYRFHGRFRVGLAVYHLSNGSIADTNPGAEGVVFHLLVPLR